MEQESCPGPTKPIEQEPIKPIEPIKPHKPRQPKVNEEIVGLEHRVSDLEDLHPELKPQTPTPVLMIIGKWLLFLIIAGVFLYGIYLFYCYDYLGKDITIPFLGILRHSITY